MLITLNQSSQSWLALNSLMFLTKNNRNCLLLDTPSPLKYKSGLSILDDSMREWYVTNQSINLIYILSLIIKYWICSVCLINRVTLWLIPGKKCKNFKIDCFNRNSAIIVITIAGLQTQEYLRCLFETSKA